MEIKGAQLFIDAKSGVLCDVRESSQRVKTGETIRTGQSWMAHPSYFVVFEAEFSRDCPPPPHISTASVTVPTWARFSVNPGMSTVGK